MSHSSELYKGDSSSRPLIVPVMLSHGESPVPEVKTPMKRTLR